MRRRLDAVEARRRGKSHELILSTRSDGGKIPELEFAGEGKMRFTQRTQETEAERLERQQREREAMRSAIASYPGPVTKCPPGKSKATPTVSASTGDQRGHGRGMGTAGAVSAGPVDPCQTVQNNKLAALHKRPAPSAANRKHDESIPNQNRERRRRSLLHRARW